MINRGAIRRCAASLLRDYIIETNLAPGSYVGEGNNFTTSVLPLF